MARRPSLLPMLSSLALAAVLAGCDMLGIESPAATAGRKEAEGKAIGSACRNATRAIEDCYTLYPKAPKAAIFAGWREMDEYMRENKLEGVAPVIPRPVPGAAVAASAVAAKPDEGEASDHDKPSDADEKSDKAETADKHGSKRKAKAEH